MLFLFSSFIFSGLQATLYFFPVSMPLFWLIITTYYTFRKSLIYSLILNVAHTLLIISFTTLAPSRLLFSMNILTLVFYIIRERFHTGLIHIALASGVSTFFFLSGQWFLQILQKNLYLPPFGSWLGISLMTLVAAYPLAYFLEKIDGKIQFERVDTLENLRI